MSTPLQAPRVRLTIEPRLQDMVGIKFPQPKVVAGRLQYRLQRRQANELGRLYGGAEVGRGRANGFQGDSSSVRIECFRTIIRPPQGVLEPGGDPLVTTPSDVGEGPAVPGRRGSTVEEDGKSQGTQALAGPMCQTDGVIHRCASQGHEREDVEHAHPGVYARLGGEVEFGGASLRQGDGAL